MKFSEQVRDKLPEFCLKPLGIKSIWVGIRMTNSSLKKQVMPIDRLQAGRTPAGKSDLFEASPSILQNKTSTGCDRRHTFWEISYVLEPLRHSAL